MYWGTPFLALLLLIIPVIVFFLWNDKKRRMRRFQLFAEPQFESIYLRSFSSFHWYLKAGLLLLSLLFLIIAATRPQWDREMQMMDRTGLDIVVCIDLSKSMDAQDIQPSRLERAKDQISLFIDQLKGDRIAIVAFAGTAFVQCPMTDDYGAAKMFLSTLNSESVPVYGTNIAAALKKADELFPSNAKNKLTVLISDGEDLEQDALSAAKKLAADHITVYTLGIGSSAGSSIPMKDQNGNIQYARDEQGNVIISKLDSKTLSEISALTGGRFYIVTPQQQEIFAIMKSIEGLEKNKFSTKFYNRYKEQYGWFAGLALLLLILESVIPIVRKQITPQEKTL